MKQQGVMPLLTLQNEQVTPENQRSRLSEPLSNATL